jgi:hypothetical protein
MHETRSRSLSRPETKRKRVDSEGNVRSSSKVPRDQSGVRDVTMAKKARKISKMGQRKMQLNAKVGESDRRIHIKKPKHLCRLFAWLVFFLKNFLFDSFRKTNHRQDRSSIEEEKKKCSTCLFFVLLCYYYRNTRKFYDRRKRNYCCAHF